MNNQYINLLSTLYPVGSIYIGTQNSCPLTSLIAGSQWQKVAAQVVTDVNTGVSVYGSGKVLGFTGQSANFGLGINRSNVAVSGTNYFGKQIGNNGTAAAPLEPQNSFGVTRDANNSGLTGSLSRTNLALNIWKRTA